MKRLMTTLLTAVLASFPLLAAETPPAGGEPADFKLTQTQDIQLDNGLTVTFIQYGKTPKATLRLITDTGNVDDGDKDAVSDIAYTLLTEGTKTRSAKEIAEAAANMGGQVNTSVSPNASYLQLDVLSEFSGDAAALLADLAINHQFNQQDLSRTINNFVRDLKVQKSQAQGQATEALYKEIYGAHPYGKVFADEKRVESLSLDDVNAFLGNNLVAKRSHLFVSGKFDQAATEKAIRNAFSAMKPGEARALPEPKLEPKANLVFIPRENAPQSTLRLGLPVVDPSHPDYIALTTMNTLLGGSFSSRITSNIREDKGYTYSPRSLLSDRVKSTLWYEQADVTAEATGPALSEIIKEIKRLQNETPSAEELQGFKNYISGIYVLQNSSRTAIINQLWFLKSHGLPLSRLETYVQQVNALTPEDISAVAKKYLTLDKMTLVVVGDDGVKPQLAAVPELKALFQL
ncbi:pitrilysin family protein [Aliiglaciecola sp. CAU 1673]|uniref:M16 family metallopeptidase n=1 Tax=Aliiglaciecola sp. CAU 1673 TaxID=3032595 RepID=UPI0023DAAD6A|nr:pitrilysin family protein [Aliiglaciecola sp. CAU 1673]MDF2179208.1 pitrilysin family protein [Aliiglaciecola sp. CAU 1673]